MSHKDARSTTITLAAAFVPLALAAALVVAQAPGPKASGTKLHPRLVSLAATRCETCHQKLFEGKPHRHAVADDCATCHELTLAETGTSVALTDAEPPLCLGCHDAQSRAAAGELKSPHAPVTQSCVACHDPHASAEKSLLMASGPQLCASCHELDVLQKTHAGQLVPSAACTSCHAAHGSDNKSLLVASRLHAPFADGTCQACHRPPMAGRVRLKSRGETLCMACHGNVIVPVADGGSLHSPVKGSRGTAGCLSCHAPHMSASPALALKPGVELCASCHPAVVAAARDKTGHAPAAEDCAGCHKPHQSPLSKLLTDRSPGLCLGCHDATDAELRQAHLGADLVSKDCITCHSPHGAGNPKLLARHVHAAIADGCETCHEGSADKMVQNGESGLCLSCHEEIGKLAATAKVQHAAVVAGKCTDCHNPHASAQPKLVKSPGAGPCVACHDAQVPVAGEVEHGAITSLGCPACHEPHGGDAPRLLRASGSNLCLSCHTAAALKPKEGATVVALAGRFEVPLAQAAAIRTILVSPDGKRGHPTPDHPLSGTPDRHASRVQTTYTGELTCLSCHDPHKGKSAKLLKGGAATSSESCLQCHPK